MTRQMLALLVIATLACSNRALNTRGTSAPDCACDGIQDVGSAREAPLLEAGATTQTDVPFIGRPDGNINPADVAVAVEIPPADAPGIDRGVDVASAEAPWFDQAADVFPADGPRIDQRGVDVASADASGFDQAVDVFLADGPRIDRGIDASGGDGRDPTERPAIAGQGTVFCGVQYCTSATGPCCPSTKNMSRSSMCMLNCGIVPSIACDGPEDCSTGLVCCSVESAAGGLAGASCMNASECATPSRVICHQQTDCPSPQHCETPIPLPAAISPPAGPGQWLVDYLVCAP